MVPLHIEQADEHGPSVSEFPKTIQELPRATSPFSGRRLSDLTDLKVIEEDLHWRPAADATAQRYGQLLVSAVARGALLDTRLWDPWINSLQSGLRFLNQSMWVELTYPQSERRDLAEDNLTRRWFADPITEMLILRWRHLAPQDRDASPPSAALCLSEFLAGRAEGTEGKSETTWLLERSTLKWQLRMPALAIEFATGTSPSVSLPHDRWARLIRGQPVYVHRPNRNSKSSAISAEIKNGTAAERPAEKRATKRNRLDLPDVDLREHVDPNAFDEAPPANRREAFELAGDILNNLDRKGDGASTETAILDINRIIEAGDYKKNEYFPLMFLSFCLQNNTINDIHFYPLKPSTILGYIPILQDIVSYCFDGEADLTEMDVDDIAEVYEELLNTRAPDKYMRYFFTLKRFHGFIATVHPSLALSFDLNQEKVTPARIDANIISVDDYHRTLSALSRATRRDRICRLLIILGFRAGLRSPEATGLEISDLRREGDLLELRIRPNKHRPLKNRYSRRTLPLDVLLTADELEELLEWYEERIKENEELFGTNAGPLFSIEPSSDVCIGTDYNFYINFCLKRATGDEYSIYHHLRHSFASFLLATLTLPFETGDLPRLGGTTDDVISHERRERIAARWQGPGKLGRSAAHVVSALCGHAHVERTIGTYSHLLDWIVGLYVSRDNAQPNLSAENARQLTGQRSAEAVLATFWRDRRAEIERRATQEDSTFAKRSIALTALDDSGAFRMGPLKPGTGYQTTLLRMARKNWGTPASGVARPVAPARPRSGPKYDGIRKREKKGGTVSLAGRDRNLEALVSAPKEAGEILRRLRWPEGPVCPYCESRRVGKTRYDRTAAGRETHRQAWQCRDCRVKFSVTAGTALHGSRANFGTWIRAVHNICFGARPEGIGRVQLGDALKLSYRSAHFLYARIWYAALRTPLRNCLDRDFHKDVVQQSHVGAVPFNHEEFSASHFADCEQKGRLPRAIKFNRRRLTTYGITLDQALSYLLGLRAPKSEVGPTTFS
jgi:integrase/transposase-like protein